MSRIIVFNRLAALEYEEAVAWYEKEQNGLGLQFEVAVQNVLKQIETNPEHFPIVGRTVRKAILRRFPYNVYFTEVSGRIVVISVFHGSRNPNLLKRRLR